jgi:hypothetical protein
MSTALGLRCRSAEADDVVPTIAGRLDEFEILGFGEITQLASTHPVRVTKRLGEDELPARFQHAAQRADACRLVRDFPNHRSQEGNVESVIRVWESVAGLTHREADAMEARPLELSPRLGQHLGLQVEQVEPAVGEPAGDLHAVETGTGPTSSTCSAPVSPMLSTFRAGLANARRGGLDRGRAAHFWGAVDLNSSTGHFMLPLPVGDRLVRSVIEVADQ